MSLSRSHRSKEGTRVEINVVPLVDVMLVLLIIFMITATFIKTAGTHITLPTSSATEAGSEARKDILIGIDAGGDFLWEGKVVTERELAVIFRREAADFGAESRVIIQGDERTAHGKVVKAMTLAQEAGFGHLVIATRREAGDGR